MPDLYFRIRWPDGEEQDCYSPSTIVKRFYEVGKTYSLDSFLDLSQSALMAASDRVRAVHGMPCSRAVGQLSALENRARQFATLPEATVTCLAFLDER